MDEHMCPVCGVVTLQYWKPNGESLFEGDYTLVNCRKCGSFNVSESGLFAIEQIKNAPKSQEHLNALSYALRRRFEETWSTRRFASSKIKRFVKEPLPHPGDVPALLLRYMGRFMMVNHYARAVFGTFNLGGSFGSDKESEINKAMESLCDQGLIKGRLQTNENFMGSGCYRSTWDAEITNAGWEKIREKFGNDLNGQIGVDQSSASDRFKGLISRVVVNQIENWLGNLITALAVLVLTVLIFRLGLNESEFIQELLGLGPTRNEP